MSDIVVQCTCGRRMRAPISALGTTGICDRCGENIAVCAENTQSLSAEKAASAPNDPTAPEDAHACARCGKPFRGDWDRHTTSQGVLCHICANRAHEGSDGIAVAQQQRHAESTTRPRMVPTAEPKPQFLKNEKTRGLLILGGLAAVTITLGLIFPVEEYIADFFTSPPEEVSREVPLSLKIVMLIVGCLLGILGFLVRIYVGIAMCDKLLNEEFYLNLIQVVVVAAAFYFVGFAAIVPLVGFILVIIVRLWLIWHIYDLELNQFILFIFIYVVSGVLLGPALYGIEQFIYALVGKIFL